MMSSTALSEFVEAEESRPLQWPDKTASGRLIGRTSSSLAENPAALSLLSTPLLTLEHPTLNDNIAFMQSWCDAHGVLLAPHGKTTMAPRLWRDQLAAGAWGITVANEAQLRVAVGSGVRHVHLASTLLSREGLKWLMERRATHPDLITQFWIDSVDSVRLIELALAEHTGARIPVLLEVGTPSGRTGTRTLEQALRVAAAISASTRLSLVGLAGYEGAVRSETQHRVAAIDHYLESLVAVHEQITPLYAEGEVFLSAGGSSYFDRVTAILGAAARASAVPTSVLLRSGAYVAHDDGIYAGNTPSLRGDGPTFRAALHAWGKVISTPEPGLAIIDIGRRDVPFDQGLPIPQQRRRPGQDGTFGDQVPLSATVTQLNDQHAFMKYDNPADIRIGDVVRLGISHPCTAFDKWRTIPLIDSAEAADPQVHGWVTTHF